MAKKSAPAADTHAISFLGFGRQYQNAANLLYEADETLAIPIYFLYSHAIELALKAYLRAANLPILADKKRKHHQIGMLYDECKKLGLRIGPDDATNMRNIVDMLEDANEDQGLRYFNAKGSGFPQLSWLRDAVEELFLAVAPSVTKRAQADGVVPGKIVKLNFTIGKPFLTPTKGN
jgi:hypothetical protein